MQICNKSIHYKWIVRYNVVEKVKSILNAKVGGYQWRHLDARKGQWYLHK